MKSIDSRRNVVGYIVVAAGIALDLAVMLVLAAVGLAAGAVVAIFVVVLFGVFIAGSRLLGKRESKLSAEYSAVRAASAAPASAAGWSYAAEGPAPSRETIEAVFFMSKSALSVRRMLDVISGVYKGRSFIAGYLDGGELGFNGSSTESSTALARGENIVQLSLGYLLPELRLCDLTASRSGDYGYTLPAFSSGNAAVDTRFAIQTPYRDFARQLLTPEMMEFLVSIPAVPCTINIRDGYLISSRDPEGSFASISERLELLTRFADIVPDVTKNAATPAVAGHGAYRLRYARPSMTVWETTRS